MAHRSVQPELDWQRLRNVHETRGYQHSQSFGVGREEQDSMYASKSDDARSAASRFYHVQDRHPMFNHELYDESSIPESRTRFYDARNTSSSYLDEDIATQVHSSDYRVHAQPASPPSPPSPGDPGDPGDSDCSGSPGDPSDSFDHVGNAQRQWKRFFRKDAYTNFTEVEYLRDLAEVSWEELLEDPKLLAKELHDEHIRRDMSTGKTETWRRPGRCTSFALVVVDALEQNFPEMYKFKYFDVGDHRLARCARSGVIIDSSSRVGVIVSRDNQWSQQDTVGQSWGKISGVSKLNRGNKLKVAYKEISDTDAMTRDICEVKNNSRGITPNFLFRSFDNGEAEYGVYVRWCLSQHRLQVFRDMSDPDRPADGIEFVFGAHGNSKTNTKCWDLFSHTISQQSGSQWNEQANVQVHREIWAAALQVWGWPVQGSIWEDANSQAWTARAQEVPTMISGAYAYSQSYSDE